MRSVGAIGIAGLVVIGGFIGFVELMGENVSALAWSIETVDSRAMSATIQAYP
ncbi:MAG: hypothetical protein ACE5KV_06490 [Thermoplasmata archaeon]